MSIEELNTLHPFGHVLDAFHLAEVVRVPFPVPHVTHEFRGGVSQVNRDSGGIVLAVFNGG